MWPEAGLKCFNGVAKQVTHGNIGSWSPRRSASKSLFNRVVLAARAHPVFYERHVLVAVIGVVESCPRRVDVHHADFDHVSSPGRLPASIGARATRYKQVAVQAYG